MKILFYIADLYSAGAERTMVNLANAMYNEGVEVVFCVCRLVGDRSGLRNLLSPQIQLINLNKKREMFSFFALSKIINAESPNIIFSTLGTSNILAYFSQLICRQKRIVVLRESNFQSHEYDRSNIVDKIKFMLLRVSYRNCNRIIALSNPVQNDILLRYGVNKNKIDVIHNPIDLNHIMLFKNTISNESDMILKLAKGRKIILGVGRLHVQKGFDDLIRIFSKLSHKEYFLVIAGKGDLFGDLSSMANEELKKDSYFFSGHIENVYPVFKIAHIFTLTSKWEGFGHVLVEAMACSLPIVSFNAPGGPQDILIDRCNALLVSPGDISDFSKKILELSCSKKRTGLVRAAHQSLKEYDMSKISKLYLNMFNVLLCENEDK